MEPINRLIDYYLDWHTLQRSVVWILRLKETLRQLKDERKEFSKTVNQTEKDPEKRRSKLEKHMAKYRTTKDKKPLTLEDMVTAESILIQFSQRQQYREDIKALQKGKQVNRNSQLLKLDPILQDGTLRVGRRLNKSAMPENVKHPAVLSKHCRVATLILRDIHQRTGASFIKLQDLRQKMACVQNSQGACAQKYSDL